MRSPWIPFVALALWANPCVASDESLAKGVPGTYYRNTSVQAESLTLKADATYDFVTRFDVGSDKESGTWLVRDSVVVLKVEKQGAFFKRKPAHFLIIVVDKDLALRVQDDIVRSEDEQEPDLIFRREKKAG